MCGGTTASSEYKIVHTTEMKNSVHSLQNFSRPSYSCDYVIMANEITSITDKIKIARMKIISYLNIEKSIIPCIDKFVIYKIKQKPTTKEILKLKNMINKILHEKLLVYKFSEFYFTSQFSLKCIFKNGEGVENFAFDTGFLPELYEAVPRLFSRTSRHRFRITSPLFASVHLEINMHSLSFLANRSKSNDPGSIASGNRRRVDGENVCRNYALDYGA